MSLPYRLLFLLTLVSCSASGTAKSRVENVRSGAHLSGFKVVTWNGPAEVRRYAFAPDKTEVLSFPFLRKVIASQYLVFRRLGLFPPGSSEKALTQLVGENPSWLAAFVVPSQKVVLVRPHALRDLALLCHEFGHLASWQKGYWRAGSRFVPLVSERPRDPNFVDLDALIGSWALEEGIAETTSRAAMHPSDYASRASIEREVSMAKEMPSILPPLVFTGPTHAVYNDLRIDLKKGEVYVHKESLATSLSKLAYETGLRFVLRQRHYGEKLEQSFARIWDGFQGGTKQLMFPGWKGGSLLAKKFRKQGGRIVPAPLGATRVGSFLMLRSLLTRDATRFAKAFALVKKLRDDFLLRWKGDGMLWISDWNDEKSAETFRKWMAGSLDGASFSRDATRVVVTWAAPRSNALQVLSAK